jgi:predicted aspartyl protease
VLLPLPVWQEGQTRALCLVGKRVGQGIAASTADGHGTLFFTTDAVSGRRFLVDTGSSYSFIPHSSPLPPHGSTLRAADHRRIKCWGFIKAQIKIGGRSFTWRLLRAQVKFPILGVDFLKHFGLMVDPVTPSLVPCTADATASICIDLTATVSSHTVCSEPPVASRGNHAAHKSGPSAGQSPAMPAKQPPVAKADFPTTTSQQPAATAGEPPTVPGNLAQLQYEFQGLFSLTGASSHRHIMSSTP